MCGTKTLAPSYGFQARWDLPWWHTWQSIGISQTDGNVLVANFLDCLWPPGKLENLRRIETMMKLESSDPISVVMDPGVRMPTGDAKHRL